MVGLRFLLALAFFLACCLAVFVLMKCGLDGQCWWDTWL